MTLRFFVIPSGADRDHWINGVDFRPGSRPVVRSVIVYVDATGRARELDRGDEAPGFTPPPDGSFPTTPPIAVWNPAQQTVLFGEGNGYKLAEGADLVIRVHYKKTWLTAGQEFSDRSTVALYLEDSTSRQIESLVVASPAMPAGSELTFQHRLPDDLDMLALLPEVQIQTAHLQIEAELPDGSRQPMLLLRRPDPNWPTRFWFDEPMSLPRGTQLDVRVVPEPGASQLDTTAVLTGVTSDAPMRLMLNYVNGSSTAGTR